MTKDEAIAAYKAARAEVEIWESTLRTVSTLHHYDDREHVLVRRHLEGAKEAARALRELVAPRVDKILIPIYQLDEEYDFLTRPGRTHDVAYHAVANRLEKRIAKLRDEAADAARAQYLCLGIDLPKRLA